MPTDEFQVLARFLASFHDEVTGHAAASLSADQMEGLARLARGEISGEAEREPWLRLLCEDNTALAYFARLVKLN